jgi:hypothetical protein
MPAAFSAFYTGAGTSQLEALRQSIAEANDPKLALEFSVQEAAALQIKPFLDQSGNLPIEQRRLGINSILKSITYSNPYAKQNQHVIDKLRTELNKDLMAMEKAEASDPYGTAVAANAKIQASLPEGVPGRYPVVPDLPLEEIAKMEPAQQAMYYQAKQSEVERAIGTQASRQGGVINPKYEAMSAKQAGVMKGLLADPTVDANYKLDALMHTYREGGDNYWVDRARMMELNGGEVAAVSVMVNSGENGRVLAMQLMAASRATPDEIVPDGTALMKTYSQEVSEHPVVVHLQNLNNQLTTGGIQTVWLKGLRETLGKTLLTGKTDVFSAFGKDYTFVNTARSASSDYLGLTPQALVTAMVPPGQGFDATDLQTGITNFVNSDQFAKRIGSTALKRVAKATNLSGDVVMWEEQGLQGLRQEGRWITGDNLDEAVLTWRGIIVTGDDGLPITIPARELALQAAKARNQEEKIAEDDRTVARRMLSETVQPLAY